jgi:hypothetical protein
VTIGGKTYDFAGERASILAQIHGHLHNYKTHLIDGTSIPRVSVPNACPSRDNEYSNAAHYPDPDFQERFGGEPTYAKNSGNENFTAFCVAVIDPAAGTVTALRYGAGVNRRVNAAGETVILKERDFDAVTALAGSGPAYFAYMASAMAEGGMKLGLKKDVALLLAGQTMYGTAKFLRESGMDLGRFIDGVCTKGGTTAAGMVKMDVPQFRRIVADTLAAAARRSEELA